MKNRLFLVAPILAFALSFPAQSQTFLTADELMTKIVGYKLGGQSDKGVVWEEVYESPKKEGKRKGKIKGFEDGKKMNGSWKVKDGDDDGIFCVKYRNYGWCGYVELVGTDKVNWYIETKMPANA